MANDKTKPKSGGNIGIAPPTPGSNKIAPKDGTPDNKGSEKPAKPSKAAAQKEQEREQKILTRIRKRFDLCVQAESENRKAMIEDAKFLAGEQWDPRIVQERSNSQRPCLTINKLPTFVHQVTNAMREQRPAINVNPIGDKSDVEAAKMWRGMIRHIERACAAEIAYDTGFDNAVSRGLGYWRVTTEFENAKTFQQSIRILRVRNIFTVYLDPNHMEPDGADAKYGFITEKLPRSQYEEEYPNYDVSSFEGTSPGDKYKEWLAKDDVRVAEYFEIVNEPRKLVLLSNGVEGFHDELAPEVKALIAKGDLEVRRERETLVPTVKWYKVNGKQIIEEKDWIGSSVPIVKLNGDEFDVEGRIKYAGIVRFAKDAQRMYNYWRTKETEAIALAPNAPWVVEEGQVEGHEKEWQQANTRPIAVLQYRGVSIGQTPAPPPQRQPFAGVPAGIVQAVEGSAQDMMATTGVRFDSTPGERMYDESGRALRELRRSGDIGSFHYTDNLARALKRTGEIIVELIPKVYDTKRIMTILREDDTEEMVMIDPDAAKGAGEMKDPQTQKIMKVFNPKVGKYGITVTIGPSYATKRVEAAESMMDFIRALPQTGEMLSDLVAKNQDWPGAPEMATRLAKAIAMKYPGVMSPDMKDVSPQVQAVLTQLQTQLQQLTQERQQMMKALTDQTADRAQAQSKIDKDFEAKLIKITADLEAKTASTQQAGLDTMMTHIAAISQNMEKVMGHIAKSQTAAPADQ